MGSSGAKENKREKREGEELKAEFTTLLKYFCDEHNDDLLLQC